MNFMQSISTCFGKYATFSGRAQRSEFWWFALFLFGVTLILIQVNTAIFGPTEVPVPMMDGFANNYNAGILGMVFSLATLLPYLAVGVRRLHDRDKSGWWLLLAFIPLIGGIILIIWFAKEGTSGDNQYGADPLA